MFNKFIPESMYDAVRDFIASMDARRDFVWYAETLVTEETKELSQAIENDEGMEQIFKEAADLIYVICGTFVLTPPEAHKLLTEEKQNQISEIITNAWTVYAEMTMKYKVTTSQIGAAFSLVHASNMSKLGDDGKPVYNDEGKVMKGPNYKKPDMSGLVALWKEETKMRDTRNVRYPH